MLRRYLLARGGDALYVAFQGTKDARDVLADVNLLSRLLWETGEATGSAVAAAAVPDAAAAAAAGGVAAAAPAVHRGVLARAVGVPIEALYAHAQRQGLRLVLCGHSLGGAVAQLCTLRLLHLLGALPPAALRCVSFGAPAVGNAALAEHVTRQGWDSRFLSIALPEDPVPRLLLQPQLQPSRLSPALWASASSRAAAVVALAQRPLAAAGGVARSAARTARAGVGMLRPPPLLPAYLHLGQLRHLRPHGVVPAASASALSAYTPDGQQQQQQQPQWRPQLLHSMQHYRSRIAALCWRHAGTQYSRPGDDTTPVEVALSRALAPAVAVQHAAALLPVLPVATAVQQQQQAVQLTVAVHGSGLEGCTGATLRLPGALAAQPAVQMDNPARAQLIHQLATASSSASSASSSSSSWLAAARHRLQQRGHPQPQPDLPPGLLLRFSVPAAALLQLHLQQQHEAAAQLDGGVQGAAWRLPTAALMLLSDFGKAKARAELQPTAAAAPPLLWRGLLLLDASPVLAAGGNGSNGVVQQLDAAAEALRWVAQRQRRRAGGGKQQGFLATAKTGLDSNSEAGEDEAEDDDVAELRQLSPAARLRRQVARAARSAEARRRRALLRMRWRHGFDGLQAVPLPALVLLTVQHRQLLSNRFGEGLDAEVLSTVRQLVHACQTCGSGGGGAPLLLAVASSAPPSTPYRQQLAVSAGLSDSGSGNSGGGTSRRGSVVPLLLPPPAAATFGRSTAEAQAGAPAGALHAAPLEAALLAFGGAAEQQARASMLRSKL
ncbi:lipase class 3-like [Micractinium conductrix]|uniref:Lipase class 3-like n=1 Tax=Micractinium conductrix TaxID=554055 RepID=A0A2P6V871_9CHLO|nr:lipase class 3-like [Micractinium conductrix]|eukprot:PSC70294.1 lipase class 3-like [Micractinium conductrix]